MIFHVTSVHPRRDQRINKYVSNLSKSFSGVTLLVSDALPDETLDGFTISSLNVESKSRLIRALRFSINLFLLSRCYCKSIYHLHDPELIPIGLLLQLNGHKVIFDVHEDYLAQASDRFESLIKRIFYVAALSVVFFSTRWLSGLVHATPFIYKNYKKYNKSSHLIANYVLAQECDANEAHLALLEQKKNAHRNSRLRLCYIGVLEEARGIREFVDVLPRFKDRVDFVLAGKFTSEIYHREVKNSLGWDLVDYRGFVNREEMSEIMCNSDVGILLFKDNKNNQNALPNKIFEYQSAGLGIIHSNFAHWQEYLRFNTCSWPIKQITTHEIAKTLNNIIAFEQYMDVDRGELISNIRSNYSWESYMPTLVQFYEKLFIEINN